MVEHIWIRLAELKEEAALEEWRARHPRAYACLECARRLRIRWLLLRQDLLRQECTQVAVAKLAAVQQRARNACLSLYLGATRLVGRPPTRNVVRELRTAALLEECKRRNLDSTECVEREDLLDLLCGGPVAPLMGGGHGAREMQLRCEAFDGIV